MVKLLIENQANVNARTQTGITPLHLAADEGQVDARASLFKTPIY